MAAKNTEVTKAEKQAASETDKASAKQMESTYTLEEFVANAEAIFNTNPECAYAALKEAGITECTKSTAVGIVKAFRGRRIG